MNFHPKFCSYYAPLLKALQHTEGDVLELGAGIHSTQFLHWICLDMGRELWTFDNNPHYAEIAALCRSEWHRVVLVKDWDDADIERAWGVALVDHAPAERRKVEIARLADWATAIVYHDSQGRAEHHYSYQEILPLFKYRRGYGKALPQSTTVSNFMDVREWYG